MTASIYARRNRGVKHYVRQHSARYMWCLKFRYEKCRDSWFIHVSSFSVFHTEPWTGKRIVGERVGWSQHPWNMNISSSFSHHQQTHTHTHTRAGFPRGLRATVVLISRQVSEGLAGYSPGSSPRDMRCCMVIRQTLSLTERKREGDRGGSSRRMMKPRHYRKPPGPDKARENTSERFIFFFLSNFWLLLKKNGTYSVRHDNHGIYGAKFFIFGVFFFIMLLSRLQYFPWQAVHKPNHFVSYSFFWWMTSCLWVTGSWRFDTQ